MSEDQRSRPLPVQFQVELPAEAKGGAYADFASVWHTQNAFVLDFAVVAEPPVPVVDPDSGQASSAVVNARVVQRIRISSEQVFPLIQALQAQSQAWLTETGRSEPPASWFPSSGADVS